jgi:hypothetical protein
MNMLRQAPDQSTHTTTAEFQQQVVAQAGTAEGTIDSTTGNKIT